MYVADAVLLSVMPALKALALIVTVPLLTKRGLTYMVEEEVGSLLSTV